MITSREDFLMTLLNCGSLDLKLIDDVGYDWCDILNDEFLDYIVELRKHKTGPIINDVMRSVFEYGISQIENAIDSRITYLRDTREDYGLSDEQAEELKQLEKIDVWEDIESYHNCIDTSIWFSKNSEIYKKYLSEKLDDFAEGTGFEIVINEG